MILDIEDGVEDTGNFFLLKNPYVNNIIWYILHKGVLEALHEIGVLAHHQALVKALLVFEEEVMALVDLHLEGEAHHLHYLVVVDHLREMGQTFRILGLREWDLRVKWAPLAC